MLQQNITPSVDTLYQPYKTRKDKSENMSQLLLVHIEKLHQQWSKNVGNQEMMETVTSVKSHDIHTIHSFLL